MRPKPGPCWSQGGNRPAPLGLVRQHLQDLQGWAGPLQVSGGSCGLGRGSQGQPVSTLSWGKDTGSPAGRPRPGCN